MLCLIVLLVVGTTLLLNSPRVQQRTSVMLATELENRIGTRVNLGGIHWLFPNDIVIDSLEIDDQEGEHLLSVNRIAAKVEWMPLIRHGQISIRNIRFFNPDILIYKDMGADDYNYQFLIDAFAAKEKREPSKLNLRINSLLVRHADITHRIGNRGNRGNRQKRPFNFDDMDISDLSAHLSLKTLTTDSISIMVRQLNFEEQSGLAVDNLYLRLVGNHHGATLANFQLDLPHSTLRLDTLWASYSPDRFMESLILKGKVKPSTIVPADFSWIIPQAATANERLHLRADFIGSMSRFNLRHIGLHTHKNDIVLQAAATANFSNAQDKFSIDLKALTLTEQAWSLVEEQAPHLYALIPQELTRIGAVSAKGNTALTLTAPRTHLAEGTLPDGHGELYLRAITDAGEAEARITLDEEGRYTTSINGERIHIARIVPQSPLTHTNIALTAQGTYNPQEKMPLTGVFNGKATQSQLLGYTYRNITLNGDYAPDLYGGTITLDDPNGTLHLKAEYNTRETAPQYCIDLRADSLNLFAMKLIDIHEQATFSTHLHADIEGHTFNSMTGQVRLDSTTMHQPEGDYLIREIALYSSDPEKKMLALHSDFMDASATGYFTYQSLASSIFHHIHHSLPTLCRTHVHNYDKQDNFCYAKLELFNAEPLQRLFLLPISTKGRATVETYISDPTEEITLTAKVPQVEYDGKNLTAIDLQCESGHSGISLQAGGTYDDQSENGTDITVNLTASAQNDKINLNALWQSNPLDLFDGTFYTTVLCEPNANGTTTFTMKSDSSLITINNSAWKLAPFTAHIDDTQTSIRDFLFKHDSTQYLSIDGSIGRDTSDTLQIDLNDIDLGYLLSLVRLKGISFDGSISGHVDAANLYTDTPYLDADLQVRDFTFCEGSMGDANAQARWNQDSTRLEFTAQVSETPRHTTGIEGHVDLKRNRLWLDIAADSTNVSFLSSMLSTFMSDVSGHADGHLTIEGPMNALDLEGALLTNAAFNLTSTNVDYRINDTIRFTPGCIHLDDIVAMDRRGQKATVNGSVTHNKLSNYAYKLDIKADNLLGINTPYTGSESYYTTIYGTGSITIAGGEGMPLAINIQATPEEGSLFALNLTDQDVASDAFITFRDRNAKPNHLAGIGIPGTPIQRRRTTPAAESTPLQLSIAASITPDATLKLVMDPTVDDHISAKGSGDLQIYINDDDISLFGTYTVNRGAYKLNLQDLITKNFDVLDGSTVSFEGDPMAARLDITARHAVNHVAMKDLSPEMDGTVNVNCLLRIGGTLNAPELAFDLELPKGTEEEKSILSSYTNTDEQMNLQFIYLLGLGKFYTQDMSLQSEGTGNMESFLSTTISGQINNIISNIISNDNWNFASNIRTDSRLGELAEPDANNWENMEFEGVLEGRLLNNRLLINGNFGYRENPMYASNFIGDFDIRYLLTNDISVKGYNKTNDRYFSKTSFNTQGIGLVFQREFERLFPTRKRKHHAPAQTTPSDSINKQH